MSPKPQDQETTPRSTEEKKDAEQLFEQLKKRISTLPERAMRREVVGELLCSLAPSPRLELLRLICIHSASETVSATLLVAVQDQDQATHQLSYDQIREIYELARERNYHNVQRLFLHFTPARTSNPAPPGHHTLSGLTLGERRTLARKHDIYTLEKLLIDPDPMVIRNLLKNPRITQKEVLLITTRRPNQAEILEVVSSHQKWFVRYPIKLALCKNPYTPVSVVLRALPSLSSQDLEDLLYHAKNLHPQAVAAAEEILRLRQLTHFLKSNDNHYEKTTPNPNNISPNHDDIAANNNLETTNKTEDSDGNQKPQKLVPTDKTDDSNDEK